jgi:carboxypeptidase Taq
MTTPTVYEKLTARSREIALIGNASALLGWDQETYMPSKAVAYRAEQLSYLAGLSHQLSTSAEFGEWLAVAESEQSSWPADDERRANVREWRRDYDRATRTPADLVTELARVSALSREAWLAARQKSDYSHFQPWLDKIIALNKRQADCWGWTETPYNALLDAYEPGSNAADLTALFADLRQTLVNLLPAAMKRTGSVDPAKLRGDYPVEAQQKFNRAVAEAMGFDFEAGRIDPTTHPFCSGMGFGDCRLTTRYDEHDFTSSLFSIMHEAGHGLYEQGLRAEVYGTPLGGSVSLGIHESQSRLWENQIGRSRVFWEYWYPRACEFFPGLKERVSLDEFWTIINHVEPSYIRTESDEVTYNLHIILRFELEKALVEGTLAAADVPAAWNSRFKELFGIEVKTPNEGCLQDIHWSLGGLGYFPTYTLGNLNAAQLFRTALRQNAGLEQEIAQGRYTRLLAWLRQNIHQHGRRYLPDNLMKLATGEPTRAQYFGDYLRAKFS